MKKIVSILCMAALLGLTACNISDSSEDMSEASVSGIFDDPDDEDSAPKIQLPEGEPTFIIGLDGRPIYTSEITKITAYDYETFKKVTTDKLERSTFESAVCEGFAYVFMPRYSVNVLEDPELFEETELIGKHYYHYIGNALPEAVKPTRAYVGDKFGELTLSEARTVFSAESPHGIIVGGGNMIFDGEIELTGHVMVTKYDENDPYPDKGGEIRFYPDRASNMKLPVMAWGHHRDGEIRYYDYDEDMYGGMYGDGDSFYLGNLSDIKCDLREGDEYVKVKVRLRHVQIGISRLATALEIKLINVQLPQ